MTLTSVCAAVSLESAVGIWLFEEGKGGTAADGSGNGRNGEVSEGVNWIEGKIGGAVEYDGSGANTTFGDDPAFSLTDKLTMTLWFRPHGMGTNNGMPLIKQDIPGAGNASYGFVFMLAGWNPADWLHKMAFSARTTRTGWLDYIGETILEDDTWYHIAGTFAPGEIILYVDGEIDTQKNPPGELRPTEGPLRSGMQDTWDIETCNGDVDEIGLFDNVMSQADIKEIMSSGLGGAMPVTPKAKLTSTWAVIKAGQH